MEFYTYAHYSKWDTKRVDHLLIVVFFCTVGGYFPATVDFYYDFVYCWWRSSCHRLVLKWHCLLLVKIFLSPFSFEVTLFTVGGDLPVTVQYWSDIVYCWRRSSCHRLVLKWHCLLWVEIFLSPFSIEVALFIVGKDLPVIVHVWSDIFTVG